MVSYKAATIIQGILIILVGISIVDFGYEFQFLFALESKNLGFNELLFSDDPNEWWNGFTMWAYLFFVVGILQLIKSDP